MAAYQSWQQDKVKVLFPKEAAVGKVAARHRHKHDMLCYMTACSMWCRMVHSLVQELGAMLLNS